MITHKHGFTVVEYQSPTELVASEVKTADILSIRGHLPDGIYHSKSMVWKANIAEFDDPLQLIRSKREHEAIATNNKYFETHGYHVQTEQLNDALFQEFAALYQKTTAQKERLREVNLYEQVMSRSLAGLPSYLISLRDAEHTLVAALAIFIKEKSVRVSVGAKQKFPHLRGGSGSVLEAELLSFCHQQHVTEISHGHTLNPAGLYTSAGVFEFKARYGYTAYPEDYWMTTYIVNPTVRLSDFVFVTIHNNELEYLVITEENPESAQKKYQTREVQSVRVITPAEIAQQAHTFLCKHS